MALKEWIPYRYFIIVLPIILITHRICVVIYQNDVENDRSTTSYFHLLVNITSLPHYESLFYKVNILDEIMKAVNGSPLTPLANYKTPCWLAGNTDNGDVTERTTRLRCLPYAMLIGVSKCGTTDLFHRLAKHPQIFPSKRKEVRFWNRQRIGVLAINALSAQDMSFTQYLRFFDDAARGIYEYTEVINGMMVHPGIVIEATPHYLWDYGGWETIPGNADLSEPRFILPDTLRILEPDLKFLVILRNPVDRLFSQFRMLSRGHPSGLFHDLVKKSLHLWNTCLENLSLRSCAYNASLIPYEYSRPGGITLRAGMYSIFLKDWFQRYPKSHFHIIKSEDYYNDLPSSLKEIFKFLKINQINKRLRNVITKERVRNSNKSNSSEPMFPETRQLLNTFYKPFNKDLAKLLENTNFQWK